MYKSFDAALRAAKRRHRCRMMFYIVRPAPGGYDVTLTKPVDPKSEYWRYELIQRRGRRNWGRDLGPGRYIWERTEFAVFA
jgi:hypothetical protein